MLNVGWVTGSAAIWRQGEDPEQRLRFPVPAYVVETESERILIDTGLHPGACADPTRVLRRGAGDEHRRARTGPSLAEQIDVGTITKVVLTHLHYDHAGGLSLLPASIPLVDPAPRVGGGPGRRRDRPQLLPPARLRRRRARGHPRRRRSRPARRRLDRAALTPGHTPGHQSVRIGDGLVLGADVAHFAVRPRRPPLPGLRRRPRRAAPLGRTAPRPARRAALRSSPATIPSCCSPGRSR